MKRDLSELEFAFAQARKALDDSSTLSSDELLALSRRLTQLGNAWFAQSLWAKGTAIMLCQRASEQHPEA